MGLIHRLAFRAQNNSVNAYKLLRRLLSGRDSRRHRETSPCGTVYFRVRNPRLERYFYGLVKFFEIAGYDVAVYPSPNMLLNLRNFNELLLEVGGLTFPMTPPAEARVVIHDGAWCPRQDLPSVALSTDYFGARGGNVHVWPYPMHPMVYHLGLHREAEGFRHFRRDVRVFVGGNQSNAYQIYREILNQFFGKVDRFELVSELESRAAADELVRIDHSQDVDRFFKGDHGARIVSVKGPWFSPHDWLRALALSDFFVAAPGVIMPFSHNVIEAMAVGTIPILQYPELFSPPLEDGVNCLVYSGVEDFMIRIRHAISCDPEEVSLLRRNASLYYDVYLSPAAAVRNFMEGLGGISTLCINAEGISVYESMKAGSLTYAVL